ncbi:hypothetical protein FQR65_LT15512 [Abscondita terminalis]|nr:hypothetical protein FQR65_LT15512 [Abscondita terminalis]
MVNISTEIRNLPPCSLKELVLILDYNESWKRLMDRIPKTLEKDNHECLLHKNNLRKYRTEHFKLIEHASKTTGRSCTEILFDEWGTSGRIRPTLGHLLYLLTTVQLFRAADFVAVNLLRKEPPKRPDTGPPARVLIPNIPNVELQEVERLLDNFTYPNFASNQNDDINLNKATTKHLHVVPKIVVTEIRDNTIPVITDHSEESRRKRLTRNPSVDAFNQTTSDMIQFSEILDSSDILPHISDLIVNDRPSFEFYTTSNTINLPTFSILNENEIVKTKVEANGLAQATIEENVPAISELLNENLLPLSAVLNVVDFESEISFQNKDLTPNLSIFKTENSSNFIPEPSNAFASKSAVPQFSTLLIDTNTYVSDSNSPLPTIFTNDNPGISSRHGSSNSNSSQISRQVCASPLPSLSLNTLLPHFNYYDIETATNGFDETPCHTSQDVSNLENDGRFLGSGAFGSVFLAVNLINKPVAVKKLFLNNVSQVNVEDAVTKQFKNEVEVLSKYKHENLLSLLGYSCDGPTYCLLYEFMSGGALKDRLNRSQNDKLIWTDRMYIALGTARAVSYLHTAYTTPLIHRDIKTANILLDSNNKPKICDFGLVKLLTSPNTNTSTTAFGTSAYMAREAFRGDVSIKLDTFSFGVVLLELITGLPPLDENREGFDIVTHVEGVCEDENGFSHLIDYKAGSWIAKGRNFAEELYKISNKCLEENRKKRPTMVDISQQLTELIKESA